MQANLPKKFDRGPPWPVTVEKQVFMKFGNSFAEFDYCPVGVCGPISLFGLAIVGQF
jgi:hypothetical protein